MCKDPEYMSKKINWEGNLLKKRKKLLANIKKMNRSIDMLEPDIMDVKKYFFLILKNNTILDTFEASFILPNSLMQIPFKTF